MPRQDLGSWAGLLYGMPWTDCVARSPADREVQRILLELLNQMDGFDQNVNVKVWGSGWAGGGGVWESGKEGGWHGRGQASRRKEGVVRMEA